MENGVMVDEGLSTCDPVARVAACGTLGGKWRLQRVGKGQNGCRKEETYQSNVSVNVFANAARIDDVMAKA